MAMFLEREQLASAVKVGSMHAKRFYMVRMLHRSVLDVEDDDHPEDTPMPLPSFINDRFEDTKFLGHGTFGEVWEALDSRNDGARVAIKMFFVKDKKAAS